MGTFRLIPQTVVRTGSWVLEGGAISDISILTGLGGRLNQASIDQAICLGIPFVNAPAPGLYGIECSLDTIELDGVPGIHANDLPVGFNITSLNLSVDLFDIHNGIAEGGNNCFSKFKILYDGAVRYDNINAVTNHNFLQAVSLAGVTILTLFGGHWIFETSFSANNSALTGCGALSYSSAFAKIARFILTGTYNIIQSQFSFALQNPTIPVTVGDPIKIDSPNGGLQDVTQVQLSYLDPTGVQKTLILDFTTGNIIDQNGSTISGSNFTIAQQPDKLYFYLPSVLGTFSGSLLVTLIGAGTQFSGSVLVGILSVLFEDASGIYRLVDNQTDDILYFRVGFTTDIKQIMLPDMREDEDIYKDDFFNLLPYPTKILAQDDIDEDSEQGDFSIISALRPITLIRTVEVPSPFIKTAFLP